jgi:hypothetical protein
MKEKLFVHHEVMWYIYKQIIFHKMHLKASGLSTRIKVELPNYGIIYQFKYAITLVCDILQNYKHLLLDKDFSHSFFICNLDFS